MKIPNRIINRDLNNSEIYYLGTGKSFNIKNIFPNDYQNFSVNNFIVGISQVQFPNYTGFWNDSEDNYFAGKNSMLNKSYDSSSGILSISYSGTVYVGRRSVTDNAHGGATSATCFAYLVMGNIKTV